MSTLVPVVTGFDANSNATVFSYQFGPVSFGGALYFALCDTVTVGEVQIFKSSDGALTWNLIANAGHPTALGPGCIFMAAFDGGHKLTIAAQAAGPANFDLWDFDLSTETWGAMYGDSGAEQSVILQWMFYQTSGKLVLGFRNTGFVDSFGVFTGGAWTFTDLTANDTPGDRQTGMNAAIDANDIIHVLITSGPFLPDHLFYQQILANGTLGAHSQISDGSLGGGADIDYASAMPAINNTGAGYIIVPVIGNVSTTPIQTILIGTGLAAPVWSFANIGVDQILYAGNASFDGTNLYVAVAPQTGLTHILVYKNPTPAVPSSGWSVTSYDVSGAGVSVDSAYVSADPVYKGNLIFQDNPSQTQFAFLPIGPPPPPPPGVTIFSGVMLAGVPIGGTFSLPDPSRHCDVNGLKKCIMIKDKRGIVRSKKQGRSIAKRGF